MNHLVFAFYVFILVSGIGVTVSIFSQRKSMRAYRESVFVNILLTIFLLWGAGCLYISANVSVELDMAKAFISGAFLMVGLFTYWIPQQHHALFELGRAPRYFLILGFLSPCVVLLFWLLKEPYRHYVLSLAILGLFASVLYSRRVFNRHYRTVFISDVPKKINTLLPILFILVAIIEGLFFGNSVIERGVTVSLPLIYIFNSVTMWVYRDQLFPLASAESNEDSLVQLDKLTQKERNVVSAVCRGLSNKQVASELNMSPSTVKNHLYSVFKKLKITNRVALIRQIKGV